MAKYPLPIQRIIASLKMLPGVGTKTAERFAFHLLSHSEATLTELSHQIRFLKQQVGTCPTCHCLMDSEMICCPFCDLSKRDPSLLCLISSPKDVYAIEDTHIYKGLYHVLGGLLSPMDGRSIQQLQLPRLLERISQSSIKEVILALDSTLEGDATALYVKEHLEKLLIPVSRLALGLPMGSPLEYIDGGTLSRALTGRQSF